MKILLIHTYYVQRGGEDLVFENECKLLSDNGVEVSTQVFYNKNNTLFQLFFFLFNPVSFIKVYRAIKKYKPQVVHLHNWHFAASISVIVACRLCRIPMVQTLHSHRLISTFSELQNITVDHNKIGKNNISATNQNVIFQKQFLHSFWIRLSCLFFKYSGVWKLIDKYIVLTEHSKNLYLTNYFKKIESKFVVKSNFLFAEKAINLVKGDYLLFVGRLTAEKGLPLILEVAEKHAYQIKIIGDGPYNKILAQSVSKYPNIEWLGFQNSNVVKQYMAESKAVIFPSITLEGMPMTIIEAFSNGIPVIASDYSAMKTMITDKKNGFLFERNNPDDLKSKIDLLYSMDASSYNKMCEFASNTYKEFYSPEMNIYKLKEIYSSLI